jgi:hypothetical protein
MALTAPHFVHVASDRDNTCLLSGPTITGITGVPSPKYCFRASSGTSVHFDLPGAARPEQRTANALGAISL